jgi:glycosyltransferase involved in cell wall biosynthesis
VVDTSVKVRVLPVQPHCFAFGGFEIQMKGAVDAAVAAGVDAAPLDLWSRDGDFDILHVWGWGLVHQAAVQWALRSGKSVVMTALLPPPTVKQRLRVLLASGVLKARLDMVRKITRLIVVSDQQAETAIAVFGIPQSRVEIIPNIVNRAFFEAGDQDAVHGQSGGYVLTIGNVCRRKNQLALAQACIQVGLPLKIIGDVLAGEERYGEILMEFVHANPAISWPGALEYAGDGIVAAYRDAGSFALPSFEETQPIALLEAGVMGKPMLTGDRPYAHQSYYRCAIRADPSSMADIARKLAQIRAEPARYVTPRETFERCRAERVGAAYRMAYEQAMRSGGMQREVR